ncbi:MAG: DUF2079 domain-containing protein [Kiritimatiellia bacterium]
MSEFLVNAAWWLFSGLVVLWVARRPAGSHSGLGAPSRLAHRVVPALAVFFAAWLVLLTWTRHRSLQTFGCDLGIFDNVLWNTVHGRFLHSAILNRHFFGEHASPILLLLAPLYALWPDARLLLAVQAAALAWAALPLYRMAARRLGPTAGVLVLFMYFSYLPLEGIYLFDFHEVALAIPLLAYAVEHLTRGHVRRMLLFLGLALLCKEELALTVAAFGLALLLFPRSVGPLPATASAAPRRKLGLAMVLAGGVLFLFLTGWVVPYFRQAPFPYVDRYSHLGGTLPGIAWTALTDPVRVLKSISEPAKLVFLRGLSAPVLYLHWLSPAAVLLSLPTLARSLLSNHGPQYALHFHFLGPLVPFVFYGLASGLGWLLRWRWPGDALPARRRPARRARLQIALLLLFCFGVVRGSRPGVLWHWAQNDLGRRMDLEPLLRQIPPDASVCAHNHLVAQMSNRRDATVFPDVRDSDWVLLDFGKPGTEYPLSREEHVRRFLQWVRNGGYGVRAHSGKFVLLQRGRSADDLDLEAVVRALFLEYGPKECVRIPARKDPLTLQWFPEIDLVGDWLFPAGEYRARYEVQARRPLRSTDRFTLLVHPRWGEFTGRWTTANRVVTAPDFGGNPLARQTFDLEFHNPTPALLSLQTVGAKSAGVKVKRIVLEPLFPMSEFVEQMVRIHEGAPAE